MGAALSGGLGWSSGYRCIAPVPDRTDCRAFCSLPLWHKRPDATPDDTVPKALTLPQVFALPGAKEVMLLLLLLLCIGDYGRSMGQQLPDPLCGKCPPRRLPALPACSTSASRWGGASAAF